MRKRFVILAVLALTAFANASIVYDVVLDEYIPGGANYGRSEKVLIDGYSGFTFDARGHTYINIQSTGNYSIENFYVCGYATVDMHGGTIDYFNSSEDSLVDIYGGTIDYLEAYSYPLINIYGGSINTMKIYTDSQRSDHYVNMFVADYNFDSDESILSGHWGDGAEFTINIEDATSMVSTMQWIKFNIVPEPMTLALFGIGGLTLRRRNL